jgi:hypothetical protein
MVLRRAVLPLAWAVTGNISGTGVTSANWLSLVTLLSQDTFRPLRSGRVKLQ